MLMNWIAARPPGFNARAIAARYAGQYSSPTASTISQLTTAS